MTKFMPCPFCGEVPALTAAKTIDDRRFIQMKLECCDIEMSELLSFGVYRTLTDKQVSSQLSDKLMKKWNTRAVVDDAQS